MMPIPVKDLYILLYIKNLKKPVGRAKVAGLNLEREIFQSFQQLWVPTRED
jgi:hypothetical protein